jgi:hypothetical protein
MILRCDRVMSSAALHQVYRSTSVESVHSSFYNRVTARNVTIHNCGTLSKGRPSIM